MPGPGATPASVPTMTMPTTPAPTSPPPATVDLTHEELSPLLDVLDARKHRAQQDVDKAQAVLNEAEARLSEATTNHALLKSRMDGLNGGDTLSLTVT